MSARKIAIYTASALALMSVLLVGLGYVGLPIKEASAPTDEDVFVRPPPEPTAKAPELERIAIPLVLLEEAPQVRQAHFESAED